MKICKLRLKEDLKYCSKSLSLPANIQESNITHGKST